MLKIVRYLPEGVPLSPHLKEKARYFFRVQYTGIPYFIPVTLELIKILKTMGISIKKVNHSHVYRITPYEQNVRVEDFIRDLIAAVYLQVRDTVGHETYDTLSKEIKDGLEHMFRERLFQHIDNTMQKKLEQKPDPKIGHGVGCNTEACPSPDGPCPCEHKT